MNALYRGEIPLPGLLDITLDCEDKTGKTLLGQHMPVIEEARDDIKREWQEEYGFTGEFPFHLAQSEYTIAAEDKVELRELTQRAKQLINCPPLTTSFLRGIMEKAYGARLGYDNLPVEPAVEIEDGIILASPTLVPMLRGREDRHGGIGCVASIFATNLLRLASLLDQEPSPEEARAIHSELEFVIPGWVGDKTARHDLGRLMRTLENESLEVVTGKKVRTLTTIGMDLGEISTKILSKFTDREDVSVIINALIKSESSSTEANHCVIVQRADGNNIWYLDPKHPKHPRLDSARRFWRRWVATNLQTVVTISQDTSDSSRMTSG